MSDELATTSGDEQGATESDPQLIGARIVQSTELLRGKREVLIVHGEQLYRLRLTRSNKLILHK